MARDRGKGGLGSDWALVAHSGTAQNVTQTHGLFLDLTENKIVSLKRRYG